MASGHQGGRKFYDISQQDPSTAFVETECKSDAKQLSAYIHENVVGQNTMFSGPFGPRPIVYCDYIASGRSLKFIENFIGSQVLPHYGNTHTTTSVTSLQTTLFRHEARDIIRNAVHAGEHDAVIFTGSGSTGAIHKLLNGLNMKDRGAATVFASVQEHHSNLLPWKEAGAQVVLIKETPDGSVDLEDLETKLDKTAAQSDLLIGCFCACSNITGQLNDDLAITALLHSYGALAFWDYATAAPYVHLDMNPKVGEGLCAKDAMYFSMHKFVGGVQTPGVLIAKKALFESNPVPCNGGGGGSVFFVTENDHKYLKEAELREEAGTPAIVESIRAGMVMQLKMAVGTDFIMAREEQLMKRARDKLDKVSQLVLLGSQKNKSLPVLSFMVKAPHQVGGYLHHNFVCALLNDLFGVQARGGCACAGPYAQNLMGMSQSLAKEYESLLLEDDRLDRAHLRRGHSEYSQYEVLRPGFARLNLPWFAPDQEVEFVLDALEFVATHGWKLMPQYIFNNETGEWRHHTNQVFKERRWLGHISYKSGAFLYRDKNTSSNESKSLRDIRDEAGQVLADAEKAAQKLQVPDQTILFSGKSSELRWMILPYEAKQLLLRKQLERPQLVTPFVPKKYDFKGETEQVGSLTGGTLRATKFDFKGPSDNRSWLENYSAVSTSTVKSESVKKDIVCVLPPGGKRKTEPVADLKSSSWRWRPPTKDIFKPFLEGIEDFEMVRNGDRVLVCLSGGKDSLTLLHTMRQYQFYARKTHNVHFDLGAITIDPQSSAYDPRPLIPYLAELKLPYLYEEQDIMAAAMKADCTSICAYCSRMKRGRMYKAARDNNYNVLAMGQHLDDLAESFLMSLFHNGRLRTMKANYTVKEGDLRVIRPFVYVREKNLRTFAETQKLPVIPENCPACFESPKERHRTKQLLAQQELLFPRLYWSLKSAMHPVMNIRQTGIESCVFGKKAAAHSNQTDEAQLDTDDET